MQMYMMVFFLIIAVVCAVLSFYIVRHDNGHDSIGGIHIGFKNGNKGHEDENGDKETSGDSSGKAKEKNKNDNNHTVVVAPFLRTEISSVYKISPKYNITNCSMCETENEIGNAICITCGNKLR